MTESPQVRRLSKVAKEFNIGINTVVDFLVKKGFNFETSPSPNSKISPEAYELLLKEFQSEKSLKEAVLKSKLDIAKRESVSLKEEKEGTTEAKEAKKAKEAKEAKDAEEAEEAEHDDKELLIKDLKSSMVEKEAAEKTIEEKEEEKKPEPKILGKIDLSTIKKNSSKKKEKEEKAEKPKKEEKKKPEKEKEK
ncbi:MAG: hypothetical protein R6T91_06480, partial [Bacteroidales bacterium]